MQPKSMAQPHGGAGVPLRPRLAQVRSAGTSRTPKKRVVRVTSIDVICVMSRNIKDRLMAEYRRIIENTCTYSISPDDYRYGGP